MNELQIKQMVSVSDGQKELSVQNQYLRSETMPFGSEGMKIYYISDLHLEDFISKEALNDFIKYKDVFSLPSEKCQCEIAKLVHELYSEELKKDILCKSYNDFQILVLGDISSYPCFVEYFFSCFKEKWISVLNDYNIELIKMNEMAKSNIQKYNQYQTDQRNLFTQLNQYLKYTTKGTVSVAMKYPEETYKRRVKKNGYNYEELQNEFELYYQKREEVNQLQQVLQNTKIYDLTKADEEIPIPVLYVLGNHELNFFFNLNEALLYYKSIAQRYGFTLLEDNYSLNTVGGQKVYYYGTIGFAGLNEIFNCNTLCTFCGGITRKDEKEYSSRVKERFLSLCNWCKKRNILLIVASHYPIYDWCEEYVFDNCIFFSGHNHQNKTSVSDNFYCFSDNQVKASGVIGLKNIQTGVNFNPFFEYNDGVYEIATNEYEEFCRFSGIVLSGTKKIDTYIGKGGNFFMIKNNGYYGFFIITNEGKIRICDGGNARKLNRQDNFVELDYINNRFSSVIEILMQGVILYRKQLEKISNFVKHYGFTGRIHGFIVDLNFYYHIMLNPFDCCVTYYYSPSFGVIHTYENARTLMCAASDKPLLPDGLNEIEMFNKLDLIKDTECVTTRDFVVSVQDSPYQYSRLFNRIQYLFNNNVLRVWFDDEEDQVEIKVQGIETKKNLEIRDLG